LARIAGVDLPKNKRVEIGLTYIFGIGHSTARGILEKAKVSPDTRVMNLDEEELRRIPSKGWAAMIRKVYEVDPMVCPRCGGSMKVVAFLMEHAVVDRIIDHLKLVFVAERPPPPQAAFKELLWEVDPPAGFFPDPPAEYLW